MVDKSSIINAAPTKELFISMLIRDVTLRDAIGDLLVGLSLMTVEKQECAGSATRRIGNRVANQF
jgi:hypothetical protein